MKAGGTGWLPWAGVKSSNSVVSKGHRNKDAGAGPPATEETMVGATTSTTAVAGATGAPTAATGAATATPNGFGRHSKPGYGRESERERLARESDAARLLSDAVGYYRLAAEAEESGGGGSGRGLFSMGWMHQVRFYFFLCLCFLFCVYMCGSG